VDWLAAAGQIDDAQPSHAEADARLHVNPLVVRASMPDHLAHPVDEVEFTVQSRLSLGVPRRLDVYESRYSTHDVGSCSMHG
jgi:hypothetical protein